MGRPKIYKTAGEAKKAVQKQRKRWNDENYKTLGVLIPIELSEKLDRYVAEHGGVKRKVVIEILENFLKNYSPNRFSDM